MEREGKEIAETDRKIKEWTEARIDRIDYGGGARSGSYIPF